MKSEYPKFTVFKLKLTPYQLEFTALKLGHYWSPFINSAFKMVTSKTAKKRFANLSDSEIQSKQEKPKYHSK